MNREGFVRIVAGTVTLIGMALGYVLSEWFYLLPVFVSVNLIQSAFTGFCPPSMFYNKYLR